MHMDVTLYFLVHVYEFVNTLKQIAIMAFSFTLEVLNIYRMPFFYAKIHLQNKGERWMRLRNHMHCEQKSKRNTT